MLYNEDSAQSLRSCSLCAATAQCLPTSLAHALIGAGSSQSKSFTRLLYYFSNTCGRVALYILGLALMHAPC